MTTEIWTWECVCCFNFIKEKCRSSQRSLLEGWRRIKHLYGLPTALLDWGLLTGKALILRTAGFNTVHFISKSWNQADRCVQHSKFGIRIFSHCLTLMTEMCAPRPVLCSNFWSGPLASSIALPLVWSLYPLMTTQASRELRDTN